MTNATHASAFQTAAPSASQEQRVFRAPTQKAAFEAVRAAFGPDALILETRELSGAAGRRMIEVVAALPPPPSTPASMNPVAALLSPRAAYARSGDDAGAPPSFEALLASPLTTSSQSARAAGAQRAQGTQGAQGVHDARPGAGHATRPDVLAPPATRVTPAEQRGALEQRGVAPTVAKCIVDRSARMKTTAAAAVQELVPATALTPWAARKNGGPRIIALIGPTGVGKTTTIAKIAARALLDEGLKVSLISLDTYRVGAVEQLARYGEILGISTVVARNAQSLLRAVDDAAAGDSDLILVDTAGRSPGDTGALDDQMAALRAVPGIEIVLTLAATSDERGLARSRARWERCAPQALIVTKSDEAEGAASILSTAALLGLPVACTTDGQRVPEDIHAYSGAALARALTVPTAPAFSASSL